MKLVILDGSCLNPGDLDYSCLKQFGELTVYEKTESAEEAIKRIGDAEIVLVNKVPINEEILNACPSVRYIGVLATGYNVIDCNAARIRGIPVTNVPDYGTSAVAQFTMALLLELCHKVGFHSDAVHQGAWVKSPVFSFWLAPQTELSGMTFGIIGLGKIGRAAGKLAKAFGMRVIAYSRSQSDAGKKIAEYVDLDTLLSESDVISLHCPLFPETEKIINAYTIAKMKKGAFLINTSRGGLVDESALANALRSGHIAGAAVDVVSSEPMQADNPLLNAENCIITPHIAWAPTRSRQRLLDCVVENIRAFLNNKPQNVVNL